MKQPLTYEQALYKASAYCATAEHCVSEVHEKLRVWDVANEHKTKILDYLQRENFIDEARYCNYYVRDKFRFNRWGKIKIAVMLRSKQIDENLINDALDQIDEDEYTNTLRELLAAKQKGLKYANDYDRQAKLVRFAQSRGFEPSLALKLIK